MRRVTPPVQRLWWPGGDGWALVGLTVGIVVLWAWRDVMGFAPLVGLFVGGVALYLALTRHSRRPLVTPAPACESIALLVVIPTKDNAGTIASVVAGCLEHSGHVLVVDDASQDNSGQLALAAGAVVLRHDVNQGKGAALHTALDYAAQNRFSHIVAIDADGQHYPDDLPQFFAEVLRHPGAIIGGVRDMSGVARGARGARANSNFWVWVETGQRMGDTQSGYRAYPVHPVRALGLVPSRYQWEVEVLVRAVWAGIEVRDLPCRVYYPPKGERVSSYRKVVDTARITWLNTQLVLERIVWPPRWRAPAPVSQWDGRSRGFSLGWRALIAIIKRGYRRWVQWLIVPVIAFYWIFSGSQRRATDAYLRRRLPQRSAASRQWAAFVLYRNFAWSLVDRFHLLLVGEVGLQVDRSGVPGLADVLYGQSASGVLLLSGHMGNADFAAGVLQHHDRRVHVLQYAVDSDIYFRMMREQLGDAAPVTIPVHDDGRHVSLAVLRALRAGEVVVMKADRVVDARSARVNFLGGTIRIPTGPFLLAALSGAPTILLSCFRTGRDTYRLEATGPKTYVFTSRQQRDADLARWAQEFADTLAQWTKDYPEQWYNFFDPWLEAGD